MALIRQKLDVREYVKPNEMWYGIDRTEGEAGIKIPVRTELVLQKKMLEAQLILNLAEDLIAYSRRSHRGERKIRNPDTLEVELITTENPANAGVCIIDAGATMKDPYYIRIYMNKTFGINQLTITWSMCSDETLLPHYLADLKERWCNGKSSPVPDPEQPVPELPADKSKLIIDNVEL